MIHRWIHTVLTTGISALRADTSLLDELFYQQFPIEDTEKEAIKTYFAAKGLNVINGYARVDTDFPAISIVLAGEREAERYIGDFATQVDSDYDPVHANADVLSSIWEHNYQMFIITPHPDMTAAYYEITKWILLEGLEYLSDRDAFSFTFSGADLSPALNYLPTHLFARQLNMSCQREFQRTDLGSLLQKAFQVSGIHVDSAGSPSDVGDVDTLVTPYTAGEDDD